MTKNKARRDSNAPIRNLSAYLLYQNAMRDEFKSKNPSFTFGQLSKFTSAMYADLLTNEKEEWHARAEVDKCRYLYALSNYVPPNGYDATGNAIISHQMHGKKKKDRDTNAPKRNVSAYLMYQNGMRDEFKRENPAMTFGQLSKFTSHMYKSLTVQEKQTWELRANQDKERFDRQMKNYVPPHGYDEKGNLILAHKKNKRNKRALKDPNAPKRARGSFVFFADEYRPRVVSDNPGIKFTDMGTELGRIWRALDPTVKQKYNDLANKDKLRFAIARDKYKAEKGLKQIIGVNQLIGVPQETGFPQENMKQDQEIGNKQEQEIGIKQKQEIGIKEEIEIEEVIEIKEETEVRQETEVKQKIDLKEVIDVKQ